MSSQKKYLQDLSLSFDNTGLSFKKATNYEHVLKEILNTREEDSQQEVIDITKDPSKIQT